MNFFLTPIFLYKHNTKTGIQPPQHLHLPVWRAVWRRRQADVHAVLHEQDARKLLVGEQDGARIHRLRQGQGVLRLKQALFQHRQGLFFFLCHNCTCSASSHPPPITKKKQTPGRPDRTAGAVRSDAHGGSRDAGRGQNSRQRGSSIGRVHAILFRNVPRLQCHQREVHTSCGGTGSHALCSGRRGTICIRCSVGCCCRCSRIFILVCLQQRRHVHVHGRGIPALHAVAHRLGARQRNHPPDAHRGCLSGRSVVGKHRRREILLDA